MPEQAEWTNGTQYNPDFGKRQHADSGDYTWTSTQPPKSYDTRTPDEKTQAAIADLQTAVMVLTSEVQHLREDIARMKTGESQL